MPSHIHNTHNTDKGAIKGTISQHTEITRANTILERAFSMNRTKDIYARRWSEFEKVWKMVVEKKKGDDAWRATLPDTWAFATIKTAQSAFVDSKVTPIITRHPDDPKSKAEDTRDLYMDIADKGNLDRELYYTRLDTFKLGNGYTKTVYVKDSRPVWEIEKFDPITNEFKWKKKTLDEFDDPKTVRVSPYLMLIDDLGRADWGTVRDCIEIEVMARDAAEAKYGHLIKDFSQIPETTFLFDQLKASSTTQVAETDGTGLRGTEFETLQQYKFFAPGFDWSNDVVEILHYYNVGIKTPSGCLDSYEILINGHPVQVDMPSIPAPIPYIHKQLPYTHYPYSPYSGDEHYASGIIEIGLVETSAIKRHREMMDDRQKLSLFSPAFSDVNDEIDQRQLKMQPLSIIRTKGGVPKQFTIPGISTGDLSLLEDHQQAYKRAVGIDERVLGLESTGPKLTATEVKFLREGAMKRLREFAFLYKNSLLHGEVKLKLSLFKQYFSNPLSKEGKIKNNKGMKIIKATFKEFKVKTGNTYTNKQLASNFFEGSDVDVDIDMQLLMPMTQAELVTLWAQMLRDVTPFIQAGVVDWSVTKILNNYAENLTGANPDALKEDQEETSIEMAESEHELFADVNTSKSMGKILPEGTKSPYLTTGHVLKHGELLESDIAMGDAEKARLLEHIKTDSANLKLLQVKQAQQNLQGLTPDALRTVGGLPAVEVKPEATPTE